MPNQLIFLINRTIYDKGLMKAIKDNTSFTFPERLYIDKYLEVNKEKTILIENECQKAQIEQKMNKNAECSFDSLNNVSYLLRGVVIHNGSISGGHYYTYIKINHNWYEFNDSSVKLVQADTVFDDAFGKISSKTGASSLFYIREEQKSKFETIISKLII